MFITGETEEILKCSNYNLNDIVTPVKVDVSENLLKEANYDANEIEFVINGFKEGFPIGYEGREERKSQAPNLRLRCGSKTQLWNKVMKEVKLGRYAGPFESIPYDNFIQSPIGLVRTGRN